MGIGAHRASQFFDTMFRAENVGPFAEPSFPKPQIGKLHCGSALPKNVLFSLLAHVMDGPCKDMPQKTKNQVIRTGGRSIAKADENNDVATDTAKQHSWAGS